MSEAELKLVTDAKKTVPFTQYNSYQKIIANLKSFT